MDERLLSLINATRVKPYYNITTESVKLPKRTDVLFVHHLPVIGGATQSLYLLMRYAVESGLNSKVLFLQKQGSAISYFKNAGFDVITSDNIYSYAHAYGAYRSFRSRRPYIPITQLIKAFSSIKTAKALLKEINPKVVYLNTSVLFPVALAAKSSGMRVIWHLREQIHPGNIGFRKQLFRYFFKGCADDIISISNINAQSLNLPNIKVIYNCVDLAVFNPNRDTGFLKQKYELTGYKVVTFLGGNLKSKGAPIFLEAAKKVINKIDNVKFLIAGQFNTDNYLQLSPTEKKVNKLISEDLKLRKAVIFTGPLENVSELLACSDLLIWPAIVPHFARPVMEAMVMGIPVIASKYESSAEIIDNGIQGFLVLPNADQFAERILQILTDPDLGHRLGKAGRTKGIQLFDAAKNNNEIVAIIKKYIK